MSLKITKVVVVNDAGEEIQLDVLDATMLAVCAGEKEGETRILSQVTTNAGINYELVKRLLAPVAAAPAQAPVDTADAVADIDVK